MLKTDKQIIVVKNKLVEIEKKFTDDKLSVDKLSGQLASAVADNLVDPSQKIKIKIEEISKRVKELKSEIELTPKIIEALKNKLSSLETEKKASILEEKIAKQKLTGEELVAVSKKFINSLKEAKVLNSKLRGLWASWNGAKEETGFSELPGKASLFSYDMLNYLGILVSEFEGREVRKREYFSRIRL